MSWHNIYQDKKGLENITKELEKVTQKGALLVISFLDRDILFRENTQLDFTAQSYMKLNTNHKMQYQYDWRHSQTQTEHIFNSFEIQDSLEKYGWLLESESEASKINCESENPWLPVLESFKVLCFRKQ